MGWWPFARKGSDVSEAPKPATASLYTDVAVSQLIGLMTSLPEMDQVLLAAGITRASLSKLETDDEIFQALRTRRDAVIATPWRLEPGTGNVTEFIIEELTPIMDTLVGNAWRAISYGYNVQEVIYKERQDGKIGLARVVTKPLQWFEPQPDMTLKYYPPQGLGALGKQVDTTYKFLLTQHDATYENPRGEAILSRLYWPWFFRFNSWRFWGQFLERFGTPILVGKSGDPKKMAEALLAAHQDAVIAHGPDDEITMLDNKGEGRAFASIEQAIIMRIQKLILGQTLTSGSGNADSGASYALGVIHNTVRDDLRKADLRLIRKTVQVLVDALCALNFPTRIIPKFMFDDGTGLAKDRAERDTLLWKLGVTFTKQYYTDRYDLTDVDFDLDPAIRLKTQMIQTDSLDTPNDGKPLPQNTQGLKINTPTQAKGRGTTDSKSDNNKPDETKGAPKSATGGSVK
jgi:phage gp29-like protein